ncbi:MAG: MutS domain [Clostridia bacterium]|jgi:dsDNA-specific endonuclease/ATPase MutS2|nr:MutS domain [Clostridia bacterium]
MRNKDIKTLEFDRILEMLAEQAMSEQAKNCILELRPYLNEGEAKHKMQETTEARCILESIGTPPLSSMKEVGKLMVLLMKDAMLVPEQLVSLAQFLTSCKRMKGYLKKAELFDSGVAYYGNSINDLSELIEEIEKAIRNGAVDDGASPQLKNIRRKIEGIGTQIKVKLDNLLRSKREWFADAYVATRNGRYTLPVKKEYKNQISGTVIDASQSGNTYFIEPSAVNKLQEELAVLCIEEDNEIRKILYTLTALVEENAQHIHINMEAMEALDVIFAKAKLSQNMQAIPVELTTKRSIVIKAGRHPLLDQKIAVPLDFQIGDGIEGVIITGPNTGGKTVALKTVGLLSMMAQSGLHLPIGEGSEVCMHNVILCDIGDGQSITENLSTFSSHITNIIEILSIANNESLVLLDELGSGTDPAEGMGIAVAVLEELKNKKCLFVATTHYPEIKEFAKHTEGLINAKMAFDRESLQPIYKLEIGEAGESCALYIAKRLGFPPHMLQRAYSQVYGDGGGRQPYSYNQAQAQADFKVETTSELTAKRQESNAIQKQIPKPQQGRSSRFNMGDSVMVYPQKLIGIVYQSADEKGEVIVQIKGKKQFVNHKRLKLLAPASELYPSDYDFSIVFDTVENRKARRDISKKHNPDVIITYENEDDFK